MRILTHQQVEGVEPGTTIDVDAERGEWLVSMGYASKAEGQADSAPSGGAGAPAKSAAKADWVAHAVAQGANEDEAEAMSKADLVEAYG